MNLFSVKFFFLTPYTENLLKEEPKVLEEVNR